MSPDPPECAACHSVIRITGLDDAGVSLLQFLDEGEDSQTILHHLQWISLGYSLLTEEEVTCPISRPDHQCGPMLVAVEWKPRTTEPLMPRRPQHGCAVLLVERIARINEEKPQSSSWACSCHRICTAWISPSNPASRPLQSCSVLQASPPKHTFPTSAVRSTPRLLALPQGTFRGQLGAPTSVPCRPPRVADHWPSSIRKFWMWLYHIHSCDLSPYKWNWYWYLYCNVDVAYGSLILNTYFTNYFKDSGKHSNDIGQEISRTCQCFDQSCLGYKNSSILNNFVKKRILQNWLMMQSRKIDILEDAIGTSVLDFLIYVGKGWIFSFKTSWFKRY